MSPRFGTLTAVVQRVMDMATMGITAMTIVTIVIMVMKTAQITTATIIMNTERRVTGITDPWFLP